MAKKKDVDFEELQDIVAGAGLDTEKIVEEVIQNFRKVVLDLDLEKEEA